MTQIDGHRQLEELIEAIRSINSDVVGCRLPCSGIEHDDVNLPRGLYLEWEERTGPSIVIVGTNPGRNGGAEADYYREHGPRAEVVERWFQAMPGRYSYHRRLRALVDRLGFTGPILWTELAKCQSLTGAGIPPVGTLRFCSRLHLRRELELVPDWPVIGTGWDAFVALNYLCLERLVIGVHHASGAWSARRFDSMMNQLSTNPVELPSPLEKGSHWLPGLLESSWRQV